MKKYTILGILLLITYLSQAQVPENINYQTLIRDNSGNFVSNETVSIRLSLLQGSPTGSVVYSEAHMTQTNDYGLINLKIGEGASSDVFSDINWAQETLFIKVEAKVGNAASYEEIGISPFSSVPYALFAKDANITLTAGDGIDINEKTISAQINNPLWNANSIQNKDISTNEPQTGDVLIYDGTQWTPGQQNTVPSGSGIISFSSDAPDGFEFSGNTITTEKVDGNWEEVAPMYNIRRYAATCEYNGKLYVFGGEDTYNFTTRYAEVYDPSSNTWTELEPMPVGRTIGAAVAHNGLIYVSGGLTEGTNTGSTRVDVYDPALNTWSAIPSMNHGRYLHSLFAYNNKLYAVGGLVRLSDPQVTATIEEYDFTDQTWTVINTIPTFYPGTVSTILNSTIYFTCGSDTPGDSYSCKSSVWSYNLDTQEWADLKPLNTPRIGCAFGTVDNHLIITGGIYNGNYLSSTELYSPKDNTWFDVSDQIKAPSFSMRGNEVNGVFIMTGGQYKENGTAYKTNSTQTFNLVISKEKVYIHRSQ
ncbi:Kelch repeat-containing protein [Carboxylicivirga sp. RSCT41]|uniref:Kelch repeat-containing protein n=1 Tax=Carboxylicivirga agarovorans TaxID=3417570 RepID=UPI003D355BC7